ncbi:primosomal protein N' [Paraglaciecola hydrolytica]|uniref:Replication restart protein PriA n=1 Tax=Paraglaciecola hydrolytica TaxID=1799789 RepID=A0A136A4M3_9ALTE|nr:primosomal protein N' [Paraglaciecola hydrolytica]KXI30198.1 primosomal protein N' [Paraglaciecola hydrolytica]
MTILRIALPIPKRQLFDYSYQGQTPELGCRVQVPFGSRTLVGVVWEIAEQSQWPENKLKAVIKLLDTQAVFNSTQLKLCQWLASYYKHPIGDVVQTALPVALRKGVANQQKLQQYWCLTEQATKLELSELKRAPKQQALIETLRHATMEKSQVNQDFGSATSKALLNKGLIELVEQSYEDGEPWSAQIKISEKPQANVQQALAISSIEAKLGEFGCFLLEGVTGSGKTEVYLQAIESVLLRGQQVLILVPEIGLTPQTVYRFKHRFGIQVGVLHSALTDNERLEVWQQSALGQLGLIIGTRSAIFTPMLKPGLLIVDEEHDSSYKQQDGLRYHARDLAVMRAHTENIPLVLGTATPALETLNNALSGKYQHLQLPVRAGDAAMARQQVFDIRQQPLEFGLAKGMLERVALHLKQGSQVMLFINRRGYAPALVCHSCGHVEQCHSCNKPFTLHKSLYKLQCHHCAAAKPIPKRCENCHSGELTSQGVGTEQLEQGLADYFPAYKSVRIDSDTTRGKNKLDDMLNKINNNEFQLLIGTQILSKGHHFPNVTLVIILDVDGALFSADYRAAEHLAQLITQLAGRAGRAEKPGEMWLQTHDPAHPLLQDLINNGYGHFARYALLERQQANLPPYSFQALFKAQALSARDAHEFLQQVADFFSGAEGVMCLGPIPALMEKRQGQYRMQLLLQSNQRGLLQQALNQHVGSVEALPLATKVRWSLDVDPQDFS